SPDFRRALTQPAGSSRFEAFCAADRRRKSGSGTTDVKLVRAGANRTAGNGEPLADRSQTSIATKEIAHVFPLKSVISTSEVRSDAWRSIKIDNNGIHGLAIRIDYFWGVGPPVGRALCKAPAQNLNV